jgi:hypothetical protein
MPQPTAPPRAPTGAVYVTGLIADVVNFHEDACRSELVKFRFYFCREYAGGGRRTLKVNNSNFVALGAFQAAGNLAHGQDIPFLLWNVTVHYPYNAEMSVHCFVTFCSPVIPNTQTGGPPLIRSYL